MGDIARMNDLERFLRSTQGQARLDEIRAMLVGRTIRDVSYSNEVNFIAATLHLSDGSKFLLTLPSLDVDVLREEFADVLEREYYKDYPGRKPK